MPKLPLCLVAGARPNFIKLAPLVKVLYRHKDLPFRIVHTGQHYDDALSESFFRILDIPQPDVSLGVGSGTHGVQTARILERFEALLMQETPRAVVVFGDVNSTLACSLAAVKLQVPVVHVEAGLRSFDRTMPEEINRIVTDSLSDLLLVSEPSGLFNLAREGIPREKARLVGNIMIDSLVHMLPIALERRTHERLGLRAGNYALLTMHRPSNVDRPDVLHRLLCLFSEISLTLPVVFPVHPRTHSNIEAAGLELPDTKSFSIIEPVDYLDALCLQKHARVVFTDSGGMQEETTYLEVPCITLRENTERPITVEEGTSTLVSNDPKRIQAAFVDVMEGRYRKGKPIHLWDGRAAARIVENIAALFDQS